MPGTKRKYTGTNLLQFGQAKRRAAFKGAKVSRQNVSTMVRRMIAGTAEKKEIETFGALIPIAAGGSVVAVNNISQGTTNASRIGNRVTMQSIYADLVMTPPTGAATNDHAWVALVYDKQPDGAVPGFSTIFDLSTGCAPGQAFKNSSVYDDRFEIAWIVKSASLLGGTQQDNSGYRKYYPIPEALSRTEFNDNATPATVGAWYLAFASFVNGGATATTIGFTYNVKAKFTDL